MLIFVILIVVIYYTFLVKLQKYNYKNSVIIEIRELEQDNINFKNKIEELTDSKSVFSEKQKVSIAIIYSYKAL